MRESLDKYQRADEVANVVKDLEVQCVDYTSLMEAMGSAKYKALTWGDGLKIDPALQTDFETLGISHVTYTVGEFLDKDGSFQHSVFAEQHLAGNRVIYELEPNVGDIGRATKGSRIKHLYVVGAEGVTVDLTEELEGDCDMYLCSSGKFSRGPLYDYAEHRIIITDLSKLHISTPFEDKIGFGATTGIPILLHEIGHYKHLRMEPSIYDSTDSFGFKLTTTLHLAGLDRDKVVSLIEQGNTLIPERIHEMMLEYDPMIIKAEEIASGYAARWLDSKKAEGYTYWQLPDEDYWRQLNYALCTYRSVYLTPREW